MINKLIVNLTKTLLYSIVCYFIYIYSNSNSSLLTLLISSLWFSFFCKLSKYPETITRTSGWGLQEFAKVFLLNISITFIFLNKFYEKKIYNKLIKYGIILNIFVMLYITLIPLKWDNSKKKYIRIPIDLPNFIASAGLLYLLFNIPNLNFKKDKLVSPNFSWLLIKSLTLSIMYVFNNIFEDCSNTLPSLVTVWLPFLFPLNSYFSVRAILLLIQIFWITSNEKSFEKFWDYNI